MEPPPVALAFVRHGGDIFLHRQQDDIETEWWSVPFSAEGTSPEEMALAALDREAILDRTHATVRRVGEPIEHSGTFQEAEAVLNKETHRTLSVDDPVRIYPVLFDYENPLTSEYTPENHWAPASELLNRDSSWPLWEAYDRIRPTVDSIKSDTEHGSTDISIRALEALRDEAALLIDGDSDFPGVEAVARELATVRPSMTAVANRIGRAVVSSEGIRTPAQVETTAHEGISRAIDADSNAAALAGERIAGARVATLSRSETVLQALEVGEPSALLVSESQPGGEGVAVAQHASKIAEVTLTSDAAFPAQLGEWAVEFLLVGADSILADGRVVNKVGTYGAALAAAEHDIEVIVVAATDKISPGLSFDPEPQGGSSIAGTTNGFEVVNPAFEAVPQSCIDAVVTEGGVVGGEEIREIASEHASRLRTLDGTAADQYD